MCQAPIKKGSKKIREMSACKNVLVQKLTGNKILYNQLYLPFEVTMAA